MRAPSSDLPLVLAGVSLEAGATKILDSLNLAIAPGPPTLIVGPNGAGKTSLLRICMGLSRPSTGRITWGGCADRKPLRRDRVPAPGDAAKDHGCQCRLCAGASGRATQPPRVARRRIAKPRRACRSRRTSGAAPVGRRTAAACARTRAGARSGNPALDEPTANLDPAATRSVKDIVLAAAQSGIKILMTSHDLGQVRRLAGDVIFLVRGRLRERKPVVDFLDSPSTPEAARFLRGDLVI